MPRIRPGRPPKAGPRKPCGRLRFVSDGGSEHLLAHRALAINPALVGHAVEELARNGAALDRRASYPLGALYARHFITGAQHYAGCRYMALFVRAVRGVGVPSVLANLVGHGSIATTSFVEHAEERAAEIQGDYRSARVALERSGRRSTIAVDNVAVYQHEIIQRNLVNLRVGLDALWGHFDAKDRLR